MAGSNPYRVGIIGGGPRGEWAAEELINRAHRDGARFVIDVWEPFEVGSGQVYQAGMPESWLLNVPSDKVYTAAGPYDLSDEDFPPRVLLGEFLRRSWRELQGRVPEGTELNHIQRRAEDISRAGDGWRVLSGEGDVHAYDELLIATGHARDWEGALEHREASVPVRTALLNPEVTNVPDGSQVGVRGAALTFIDLIQDWHAAGCTIYPTNRGGRFMEVKPPNVPEVPAQYLDQIRDAADMPAFHAVLADAAVHLVGPSPREAAGVVEKVEAVLAGADFADFDCDPVAELRESLRVAEGAVPVSESPKAAAWAVGLAWRGLYPAIIDRTSLGGKETLEGFDTLARRMERVAFGPPPKTARNLLAALDSGLVDPRFMGRAKVVDKWLNGEDVDGTRVDLVIDAVIPPPGDEELPKEETCTLVGRMIEGSLLGHDTLNRDTHDVIPRWADAVSDRARIQQGAAHARGIRGAVPLTARLEPWMQQLTHADADQLIREHGSPVNVLNPEVLPRNARELTEAGSRNGVEVRVHFARKANKVLAFVDAARDNGHGIDVASLRELTQVLDRGVDPQRIILSAAIKPDELLTRAVGAGVVISVDTVAELERVSRIAGAQGTTARVAPRLAPDPDVLPPTRFGERLAVWEGGIGKRVPDVDVVGVHLHLGGYSEADRRAGLAEALALVDAARNAGHSPEFIDLGGGIPMSYLDDANEWFRFQHQLELQNAGQREPFTWKAHPLANTYPFWQTPVRGGWLNLLLNSEVPGGGSTKEEFSSRGLRLHVEPGRSLLDGGGVILARVAFVKKRSDGVPLVGVEMNRTQCKTAADDLLLDPLLLRSPGESVSCERQERAGVEAYLVGAYCIENEVFIHRRLQFPDGVAPGDIVAIPNTAGYFMHILESASHQIPLAKNVIWGGNGERGPVLDDIDYDDC